MFPGHSLGFRVLDVIMSVGLSISDSFNQGDVSNLDLGFEIYHVVLLNQAGMVIIAIQTE